MSDFQYDFFKENSNTTRWFIILKNGSKHEMLMGYGFIPQAAEILNRCNVERERSSSTSLGSGGSRKARRGSKEARPPHQPLTPEVFRENDKLSSVTIWRGVADPRISFLLHEAVTKGILVLIFV